MKLYYLLVVLVSFSLQAQQDFFYNCINNPKGIAYNCRLISAGSMALNQPNYDIYAEHNGDDSLPFYAGSFTKNLQHDPVTGLLTEAGQASYQQLLTAVNTGLQEDFNAIVRAPESVRKYVNPQSGFCLSLEGTPGFITPLTPAPNLSSAQAAADIIENYLEAICRNVKFAEYGTGAGTDVDTFNGGSLTNNAAAVLTALGDAYKGPRSIGGTVTAAELFRGLSVGDLVGPYVSQFWWLPVHPFFQSPVQKQYLPTAQAREFGVSFEDFVAIQNGAIPKPYNGSDFSGERYIINGKDVSTSVHNDGPGEFFFYAINILLYNGAPLAPNLPYQNGSMPNEAPFVTMMIGDMYNAVFGAMYEAFKNTWAHKWCANRKLRPEAMAGLVHRAKVTDTNPFNLYSSIFSNDLGGIDLLAWVRNNNEQQAAFYPGQSVSTYLLPQMYPEGSPTHPSYPAGHATVASACATVVKVFFDNDALLNTFLTPMKPDPADATALIPLPNGEGANQLTIAGELDKLASNVGIARNIAGVHYRSDGDESATLGETVAIKYLQDRCRTYHESGFTGYELTKRNGVRIRITPEGVTVI